jgi:phosphatidylserine/phosphatidylglycerophosphate/cardiolipin synthase-like enzyme
VAADIAAAKESVDVASFEFDLESLTQALIAAHARGVRVRVVLDDGNLGDEGMSRLTQELEKAGIPIVWDQRQPFMHDKFVLIDGTVLWMGSWNLTVNDTYANNNNAIRFAVPELVANYAAEFEEMFVDKQFGPLSPSNRPYPVIQLSDGSRVDTQFSPDDKARAALIAQLRQAQREILFLAFAFTDEDIARVLLERARAGVVVRGVFEARNEGEYSQYSVLKKAELDVRLDGNPRTMHHKVFVIDGQVTITGSYNFSSNAAYDNDENLMIIHNPDIARSYAEEFSRVYQAGGE